MASIIRSVTVQQYLRGQVTVDRAEGVSAYALSGRARKRAYHSGNWFLFMMAMRSLNAEVDAMACCSESEWRSTHILNASMNG